MTAPILLLDVHETLEATSRPQNHPRKHLSPEINTDQGGFEPPIFVHCYEAPASCTAVTRPLPLGNWSCGKKGTFHPSTHKKPPHQPPQHPSTLKEKERPRHFRLLPHVGAGKLARAIQLQETELHLIAFVGDTLADKEVAACIHSSHNAQSCKANGVSSRLKL